MTTTPDDIEARKLELRELLAKAGFIHDGQFLPLAMDEEGWISPYTGELFEGLCCTPEAGALIVAAINALPELLDTHDRAISSAIQLGREQAAKVAEAHADKRARILTGEDFDPRTDWDEGIEAANSIAAAIRALEQEKGECVRNTTPKTTGSIGSARLWLWSRPVMKR